MLVEKAVARMRFGTTFNQLSVGRKLRQPNGQPMKHRVRFAATRSMRIFYKSVTHLLRCELNLRPVQQALFRSMDLQSMRSLQALLTLLNEISQASSMD